MLFGLICAAAVGVVSHSVRVWNPLGIHPVASATRYYCSRLLHINGLIKNYLLRRFQL